jgi:hypothetical protein
MWDCGKTFVGLVIAFNVDVYGRESVADIEVFRC